MVDVYDFHIETQLIKSTYMYFDQIRFTLTFQIMLS